MNYVEFMRMDRSIPPVVITADNRTEYMKQAGNVVDNFRNLLAGIYTDESKQLEPNLSKYWKDTQAKIGEALCRHFQYPKSFITRMDLKAVVAYGVYEAYVKYDCQRHFKLVHHDWDSRKMKGWIREQLAVVTSECYNMISINQMESK